MYDDGDDDGDYDGVILSPALFCWSVLIESTVSFLGNL
jgi:hypothetical protein